MGDTIAFLATIFAIFAGFGEVLAKVGILAAQYARAADEIFERDIIPKLAKFAIKGLYFGAVLVPILYGIAILWVTHGNAYRPDTMIGYVWEHSFLTLFVIAMSVIMVILADSQRGAIAQYRYDDNGLPVIYPRTIPRASADQHAEDETRTNEVPDPSDEFPEYAEDEPETRTNEVPHPYADQHAIDDENFRPEDLRLGATIFVLTLAMCGLAVGLGYDALMHGDRILMVIVTVLGLIVIEAHYRALLAMLWAASKSTLIAGFLVRVGAMQILLPLSGITQGNVAEFVDRIRGVEFNTLRLMVERPYRSIMFLFTFLTGILIIAPYPVTAFIVIPVGMVSATFGRLNGWHNPLSEQLLTANTVRKSRVWLPLLLGLVIVWEIVLTDPIKARIATPFTWAWDALFGATCVPLTATWWHSLGSLGIAIGLILLVLWLLPLIKARVTADRWLANLVLTFASIAIVTYLVLMSVGAGREIVLMYRGEQQVCPWFYTGPVPATVPLVPSTTPPISGTAVTGSLFRRIDGPTAPAPAPYRAAPRHVAEPERTVPPPAEGPETDGDGFTPEFRQSFCQHHPDDPSCA